MKNLIKSLLLIIARFVIRTLAIFMLPLQKGQLSPDKIKRILIYGQMGIGNMIMFTPFLKTLRDYFPSSQIRVLFLRKNGADQVLEGGNLVDEIVIWNYWDLSLRRRLKAIWQMKSWKPDLIISRFASRPIDYALIALLSRAPYRMGHVSSAGWKGRYDYLNNYPVKMNENEHEIDRDLRLAVNAGIPIIDNKTVFHIGNDDEQYSRAFLEKHGINADEQFVTIQLGTSPTQSWKRWEMDKWSRLTENLLQNNIKIVAVGSPDERDLIEKAFAGLAIKPISPIIAAGELTLKQTAAVIRRSHLTICHDSGLMHVAAAMDTPVVAIFGPGDHIKTAPLDKKHIIIRKDLTCSPCVTMKGLAKVEACQNRVCLSSISVEEVWQAVRRQLKIGGFKEIAHGAG